jgi:hypothetical protein
MHMYVFMYVYACTYACTCVQCMYSCTYYKKNVHKIVECMYSIRAWTYTCIYACIHCVRRECIIHICEYVCIYNAYTRLTLPKTNISKMIKCMYASTCSHKHTYVHIYIHTCEPSSNSTITSSLQFITLPSQPSATTQFPCLYVCMCVYIYVFMYVCS